MADKEAAARLKKALRVAMASAGYNTWFELAMAAHVSENTIDNWVGGVTVPRAKELAKVAEALRPYATPSSLERAYYGLPPEEPPLIDMLRVMIPELHELVVVLRAQADQAVLEAVRQGLEERRRAPYVLPEVPDGTPSDAAGG